MSKNPVIEKARQEGYNAGFKKGMQFGQENACIFFADKFEGLEKIKGIGPKTMEIVVNHFGREFFQEVEHERTKKLQRS